jgi:hypothetical protein
MSIRIDEWSSNWGMHTSGARENTLEGGELKHITGIYKIEEK